MPRYNYKTVDQVVDNGSVIVAVSVHEDSMSDQELYDIMADSVVESYGWPPDEVLPELLYALTSRLIKQADKTFEIRLRKNEV